MAKYTENLIPKMTSDSINGITVSANSDYGNSFKAWNAFDRDSNKYWVAGHSISIGWLKVNFGINNEREISKYTIKHFNNAPYINSAPRDWTFEGSNDNINWDILDEQNNEINWKLNEQREYTFKNFNKYQYYRLNISRNNGSQYVSIDEIEMMESININKYLIKEKNQYYTIDNIEIILSLSQILDEDNFNNNGFNDIDILTKDLLLSKFKNLEEVKLLVYTDDLEKNKCEMIYNCESFRPIDKLKKNSDICNILFREV
ncbi:discoidin domain-containing protein [Clostridium botulinum]|uniref:F5/8 type C domain-containing protein n=1 Tax=Clostridium botulinum (strain Okra / Type B1) TaxID=498213 RepID=B1IM18_CLOBK|nr:discoidin domain-containing protein [Clostridium botulinum]ACA43446.1 conserved hypothetical protein [Clostridium botulinum B1 str. Okra]MBD5582381.1 discoidin domain-containing protein [Clostridium botulinum]MBD5592821.1 discoidin domain-containing protein [Clostridium botulinum]MBD5624975.1 discoidin domain-containing protein [Clostridium botulinum]MBD5630624.1 discoidin domain-containing protein [Clostridium botulinum]